MRAKENLVHPDKESSVRAEKGPISANRLGVSRSQRSTFV